jgi:maleylacetoacetate isomerase
MVKLYSYWRSSAAYRVRIALALKGVPYEYAPVHLTKDGGEQNAPAFRALNPQGRVDYLESRFPEPALLPPSPAQRARVVAFCHTIVSDIQPLQNTAPLRYMADHLHIDEDRRNAWVRHWIERGLAVLEQERAGMADTAFTFGDAPTWADCVLVPQVYNVDRYRCDTAQFPRLYALARRIREQPAFAAAHPDRQPDCPGTT